jgi:hypothetical protein
MGSPRRDGAPAPGALKAVAARVQKAKGHWHGRDKVGQPVGDQRIAGEPGQGDGFERLGPDIA